jgi:hypothetical protein
MLGLFGGSTQDFCCTFEANAQRASRLEYSVCPAANGEYWNLLEFWPVVAKVVDSAPSGSRPKIAVTRSSVRECDGDG